MRITVTDAKGQLADLVRKTEAGDEVILTRHGQAVARLVPVIARPASKDRRKILERASAASKKASPGANAAHSQDFLYGEDGLPT